MLLRLARGERSHQTFAEPRHNQRATCTKARKKPKTVKSEDRAVTVVGVVVVDVTVAVNVAEVVAVAGVWRTEPPVVRGARAIFTACNLHYEITAALYTFREGFSSRILRGAALSTLFPTTLPKPLAE